MRAGVHPVTEAQQRQREQFVFAPEYAKEVAVDPTRKAVYEALAKGQSTTWRVLRPFDRLRTSLSTTLRLRSGQGSGQAGQVLWASKEYASFDKLTTSLVQLQAYRQQYSISDQIFVFLARNLL